MNTILKLMASVCLCLFTLNAWADSSISFDTIEQAAKRSSDLSRQILVMIFGDVVINPFSTDSSMIGELFFVFNGIVLTIAVVWFLAVTLKHLTKAGQQGKIFNNGTSLVGPVTTAAGFLSLVPTISGWSIAQLLFLWAASVMGIGSANLVTDRIVDLLEDGYSLVVQPTTSQTLSSARAIYEMNLCMYGMNNELNTMYRQYGQGGTPLMSIKSAIDGFEIGNGSALCGSARLPESIKDKTANWLFPASVDTVRIIDAQRSAMNEMQNNLSQAASEFVTALLNKKMNGSGTLPDAETSIQKAAQAYEDRINQALKSQGQSNELASVLSSQLKKNGWLALGSWYQTFATANNKVNEAVQLKPIITGISGLGDLGAGDTYKSIMTAYQAQLQNSSYTPPLGIQSPKNIQQATDASDPAAVFVGIFNSPGQRLSNHIVQNIGNGEFNQNGQINPLLKMKNIGDYVLIYTESVYTIFAAAKIASETVGNNFLLNIASLGLVQAAPAMVNSITPLVQFMCVLLFGIGFSLSIYLPFIPFIYWIAAAANWIVSVFVGATGGSLWAATHIGTENEGGHRSSYGYIFLIDVMIRPMLMVFGFVFASIVTVALGTLLNIMFGATIANVQANSITGLVSLVGILMVYARICTTTVSRVFGLQVTMPDYIISWLGGREAAGILGGIVESTKSIFAGFGSGLERSPGVKYTNDNKAPHGDGIK
ncbi:MULTISPECIES: DotA/TraY family protein [Photorhabdus]|uniref:Conjugal transfer protein n=2 Tax=Photorhabdus TaxID=29487 RepID=A0A7X5QPY5_9GAMM|nr:MULTISPECIES: DotA/TraY family protein [Photorhabdus]MQL50067.1 DotA/TraY family protein [Photorhabdus khanii]NHB98202.1 conjugal transfer protein [Photorhabdus stackebrandtii]